MKRKVALASVLKPVDDTRMFEKIGQSLANSGQYSVHLFGFPSSEKGQHNSNLFFHPHLTFGRLSFYRLALPWLLLRKLVKLKPQVLIVTTHELLFVGVIVRLLTKCRLVYDVRENYFLNLLYQHVFPPIIKHFLALFVRSKEIICSQFIDHFFLAEQGYEKELSFISKRYSIIENKALIPTTPNRLQAKKETIDLVFSGTLAETTGVFVAIELAKQLHLLDPTIRLHIIGYAARGSTLKKISQQMKNLEFIKLTGGDRLIPHDEILRALQQADFGIISYPYNPSTQSAIPTKLYEYLALQLPFLLVNNALWVKQCAAYPAAIIFDPKRIDGPKILQEMKRPFYLIPPQNVTWTSEEPKLLKAIAEL